MPVLDPVVLFGAADEKDKRHERSVGYMEKLGRGTSTSPVLHCLSLT